MKKWFPIKGGMLSEVKIHVRAVDGVDLQIKRGETLGIVGESGCGKTTLGRVLLGLIPITDGSVLYDGEDIRTIPDRELRRRMQIVSYPQRYLVGLRKRSQLLGETSSCHSKGLCSLLRCKSTRDRRRPLQDHLENPRTMHRKSRS